MPDPRRRHQFQQAVDHAQSGAQDRDDRRFAAGQDRCAHGLQRRIDLDMRQWHIPGDLIPHQKGDFLQQGPEHVRRRVLLPQKSQLMLNQRMIDDVKRGEVFMRAHGGGRSSGFPAAGTARAAGRLGRGCEAAD